MHILYQHEHNLNELIKLTTDYRIIRLDGISNLMLMLINATYTNSTIHTHI